MSGSRTHPARIAFGPGTHSYPDPRLLPAWNDDPFCRPGLTFPARCSPTPPRAIAIRSGSPSCRKTDKEVAPELELHIICDNYSTHKHAKVTAWLKRHPRFHLHFIPTSSSWLNLVERFFGEITAKVIRPGSFRSLGALIADIFRFLDHHNLNPKPYRWTADPKRILEKLDRAWEAMLEEIHNPVYGTSH